MELEITTAQEVISSKKSIVLHSTDQGNGKVVLVKHYISPSGRKGKKLKPAFTEVNATSKAYKRKSFELVGSKENDEQYASVKRRRSVQLGGSERILKTLTPVAQPCHSSLSISNNVSSSAMQRTNNDEIHALHAQSKKNCRSTMDASPSKMHVNERMDFQSYDQQHCEGDNKYGYGQDTILLPENWLDKRYKEDLLDSDTLQELDEHKSFFAMSEQETPQVKSNGKCKSLFATYHLNNVCKSIIDEM